MTSSPGNQHFICEQEKKSVGNFRTFIVVRNRLQTCTHNWHYMILWLDIGFVPVRTIGIT